MQDGCTSSSKSGACAVNQRSTSLEPALIPVRQWSRDASVKWVFSCHTDAFQRDISPGFRLGLMFVLNSDRLLFWCWCLAIALLVLLVIHFFACSVLSWSVSRFRAFRCYNTVRTVAKQASVFITNACKVIVTFWGVQIKILFSSLGLPLISTGIEEMDMFQWLLFLSRCVDIYRLKCRFAAFLYLTKTPTWKLWKQTDTWFVSARTRTTVLLADNARSVSMLRCWTQLCMSFCQCILYAVFLLYGARV